MLSLLISISKLIIICIIIIIYQACLYEAPRCYLTAMKGGGILAQPPGVLNATRHPPTHRASGKMKWLILLKSEYAAAELGFSPKTQTSQTIWRVTALKLHSFITSLSQVPFSCLWNEHTHTQTPTHTPLKHLG